VKDGCTGITLIKQEIEHRDAMDAWLKRLPREVAWCGERLPALTQKVFLELLRAERRNCPTALRRAILEAQSHNCALCGGAFDDDIEWDHVAPLQQMVRGSETLWQAVCASCHLEKTSLEGKQDRTLESRFCLPVWQEYVLSARPPALIFQAHDWGQEGEAIEIDVRRCRRNALMHSSHDFPVFCPLDSITEAREGTLADFSYVDIAARSKGTLSLLPYYDPNWYHRVAVEHLLHFGIATWQDIKFSLHATGRIPAHCLQEPLRVMEDAWDEPELAKLSVNQMIGLWAKDHQVVYHCKTSNCSADGHGAWARRLVEYDGGLTTDFICDAAS
jgi:5-methylcytosine-specific restriction endonuclease McrA